MTNEHGFAFCGECFGKKPGREWCLDCVRAHFNVTHDCGHDMEVLTQSGYPRISWCRICGLMQKTYGIPTPRTFYYEPKVMSQYHGKSEDDSNG